MLTEDNNIYLNLPGSEIIEIYSKLDKEKYPDRAKALEDALRLRIENQPVKNDQKKLERGWKKGQTWMHVVAIVIFLLLVLSKHLYTPDLSEVHNYAIFSLLINITLISVLLVLTSARSILAAVLLLLYFIYIMFGVLIF